MVLIIWSFYTEGTVGVPPRVALCLTKAQQELTHEFQKSTGTLFENSDLFLDLQDGCSEGLLPLTTGGFDILVRSRLFDASSKGVKRPIDVTWMDDLALKEVASGNSVQELGQHGATAELWAILTFEKGWLEAVQSSLHWLCDMLSKVQHFEGLFFRECLQTGAVLPADISDERYMVVASPAAALWEALSVLYALLNADMHCEPEPGIGSKRFDDGHKVMLLATRASGPSGQWNFTARVDEANTPSQHVLSLLKDLFLGGEARVQAYEHLLCEYRAVFASQCLQKTRLRATALQWQAELEETFDLEFVAVRWMAWHRKAAETVTRVDFVEWLSGEACTSQSVNATFRDARVSIPWLEFDLVILPKVGEVAGIGLFVGHDGLGDSHVPSTPQRVIHKQECQAVLRFGKMYTFSLDTRCIFLYGCVQLGEAAPLLQESCEAAAARGGKANGRDTQGRKIFWKEIGMTSSSADSNLSAYERLEFNFLLPEKIP
ncbi:hypothetical protein AK812_SmicGene5087 [Symbiodinium microadriaticum]|uniref:Uncharacterized protein n=1 Tax=Symbiodinium microadriaticum TaxID=2951 RepID=A0A1Q9EUI4_SYMMI|nr:hypothetical protein AK812_SmicGene5087 [Symbiodinium microadriaticum]